MEERELDEIQKIGRSVKTKGKKGPLKGALRIWPLGTESRRAGSTGPRGGTSGPPKKKAFQRLREKTPRGGTSGKRTGTSGIAVVPEQVPVPLPLGNRTEIS